MTPWGWNQPNANVRIPTKPMTQSTIIQERTGETKRLKRQPNAMSRPCLGPSLNKPRRHFLGTKGNLSRDWVLGNLKHLL